MSDWHLSSIARYRPANAGSETTQPPFARRQAAPLSIMTLMIMTLMIMTLMAATVSVPTVAVIEPTDVDATTAIVAGAIAVVSGAAAVVAGFGRDAAGERQQSHRNKRQSEYVHVGIPIGLSPWPRSGP
jgi:hypothetical protein